jgi:hypothetical protein
MTSNSKFGAPLPDLQAHNAHPRAYRPHLTPQVSVLRPHCVAQDRLRLWQPIQSRKDNTNISIVSEVDLERILTVINVSWAQGTRETYGSGLLVFHVFCDSRCIPEESRCPASPLLVINFISACAGSYSGGTLGNYVFGVRAWHILHGQQWHMNEAEVDAALKGAAIMAPPSSRRAKRAPFTVELVRNLLQMLNVGDSFDAAVAACLTTTFWSVARTGEFTVPSIDKFDPSSHVKRSNIWYCQDRHGLKVTVFALPRTKCSSTGEEVYWAAQEGPTDPAFLLANHLQVNAAPSGSHLFAYKHERGLRPLTKRAFMDRLNTIAALLGLSHLKGHGIRIGSTLEYLLRGVPFDVMKAMGRWMGEAFLLYLRQHAVIMAPYMQAHPVMDAFTRYTMPPVRR